MTWVGYVIKNFLSDKLQFVDKLKLIEQQALLGITNKFRQD
jgi:nitrogen fixation protein FixH